MAGPYDELPAPVDFDKLITSAEVEPVPDPEGGRNSEQEFAIEEADPEGGIDPEREFMLRWAGLG